MAAAPVGPGAALRALDAEADEVVCPQAPEELWAVSIWYCDFGPVGEGEVRALLAAERAASRLAGVRQEGPA